MFKSRLTATILLFAMLLTSVPFCDTVEAKSGIDDIAILNAMGISAVESDGYITRGDFTVLTVQAAGIEHHGVSDELFSDTSGEQGEYIAAASMFGYVNGMDGDRFCPNDIISIKDATTIALRVLGFGSYAQSDMRENIISLLKLSDSIPTDGDLKCSDASVLIMNMLEAGYAVHNGQELGVSDETLMYKIHGVYRARGKINGVKGISLFGYPDIDNDEICIDNKIYINEAYAEYEYLGNVANVYIKEYEDYGAVIWLGGIKSNSIKVTSSDIEDVSGSSAYAFNYVHEDNFESKNLTEYTIDAKNGAMVQVTEDNENNVLKLISTASNVALLQKSFDSLDDIAIIDMDFMRESLDSGSVRIMQIYDSAKSSRPFLLQSATAGLTVRVGESTSVVNTTEYDLGVWVNLRVVLDFSTETYDVYVNGKLCCEGKDFFQSSSNAGIIQIQMDNKAGTTGAYVDNIAIYGINNEVLDNAILQAEKTVASYVIGQQTGNYSQTRYDVFKDKLKDIRDISREPLSNEEQLEAVSGLEAAVESFDKGKICSESEVETVETVVNEIVFDGDKSTIFTSDDTEYTLNVAVLDNFNRNYAIQPDWELVDAPERVTLNGDTLVIPKGVQGNVKVKATVEDVYRSFTIYLRDYSKVSINKITATDGFVKINGTVARNSEDDININLSSFNANRRTLKISGISL